LDKVQLEQTSRREHLAEGTLLRKLALEGIARYRLESAIHAYSTGEIDLREAARQADVRVQRLVAELDRRGIGPGSGEHVLTSGHVGCAPAASEARVSDEFRPVGHFGRLYSPACADAPGRDLVGTSSALSRSSVGVYSPRAGASIGANTGGLSAGRHGGAEIALDVSSYNNDCRFREGQ
jgi:hypothetical protein